MLVFSEGFSILKSLDVKLQDWQKFLKKYFEAVYLDYSPKTTEIGLFRTQMQIATSINLLSHLQGC